MNADDLERAYQNYLINPAANTYNFGTQKHRYQLNFQTMHQQNLRYTTQRKVRRRPKFVTQDDRWKAAR